MGRTRSPTNLVTMSFDNCAASIPARARQTRAASHSRSVSIAVGSATRRSATPMVLRTTASVTARPLSSMIRALSTVVGGKALPVATILVGCV